MQSMFLASVNIDLEYADQHQITYFTQIIMLKKIKIMTNLKCTFNSHKCCGADIKYYYNKSDIKYYYISDMKYYDYLFDIKYYHYISNINIIIISQPLGT